MAVVTAGALLLIVLWKCKRPSEGIATSTFVCSALLYLTVIQDLTTVHYISVKPPEDNLYTKRYIIIMQSLI